jgi:hypothetical protein
VARFRRSENHELETELRKHRPQARSAFVSALAAEVHGTRRTAVKPRLAIAGAIAVATVTFFAVFGGVGYTTSAVSSINLSRLGQAVGQNNSQGNNGQGNNNSQGNNSQGNNGDNGNNGGPDDDQYKPGKGCGDKNHVHERENECKKLK